MGGWLPVITPNVSWLRMLPDRAARQRNASQKNIFLDFAWIIGKRPIRPDSKRILRTSMAALPARQGAPTHVAALRLAPGIALAAAVAAGAVTVAPLIAPVASIPAMVIALVI